MKLFIRHYTIKIRRNVSILKYTLVTKINRHEMAIVSLLAYSYSHLIFLGILYTFQVMFEFQNLTRTDICNYQYFYILCSFMYYKFLSTYKSISLFLRWSKLIPLTPLPGLSRIASLTAKLKATSQLSDDVCSGEQCQVIYILLREFIHTGVLETIQI